LLLQTSRNTETLCCALETQFDYKLLAVFIAVADHRSFSKAARKLGMTKGTASRAIARLEELVGAELLHRTTHTVVLSTAGTALYERTAPHLAALDQAMLKLPERADAPSGELRLTAPNDFGSIVLPEIISQFSRRYPDIRFDIRITNDRLDLVAEGFDLAFRAGFMRMKDSNLTVRRVGLAGVDFFASPSYIARRGKPSVLGDPRHEWSMPAGGLSFCKVARSAVRFLCDDFLLIRNLVRDGASIGMLPRFIANPWVREGLIESLPVEIPPTSRGHLLLAYPSSGRLPRKVTAFRDFVIDYLKKTALD
jgi:DNA-binding transcriptional LysR family regulator